MPEPPRRFPYVRASGGPRERGRAHGEACGEAIAAYAEVLVGQVHGASAGLAGQVPVGHDGGDGVTVAELERRARRFLPLLNAFAPDLVEEMDGIAEGAGLDFDLVLLANVRGETARAGWTGDGCSALAVGPEATADGHTIVAQNMDGDPEMDPLGIVLHVEPDDGPPAIMMAYAGLVGYHGMGRGIAQAATALSTGSWRSGLPQYLFKRRLLEQESVEDALRLIRSTRFCSAGGYVLGDRAGRVTAVELAPRADGVRASDGDGGAVAHTNHFRDPDFEPLEQLERDFPDTRPRLAALEAELAERAGGIGVEDVQEILSTHAPDGDGICRHGDLVTIGSFVADVTAGEFHVCRGNPCSGEYERYALA
jgi:isopenicillin-N N-acyltransferase-like protein